MIMKQLLLFMAAALMAGCDAATGSDQGARDAAGAWADAYFNCDFKDAATNATAESDKWLRFAASNTTEEDLKLVNGGATVSAADYFTIANDTLRVVTLTVRNFLKTTAVGAPAELQQEGRFLVTVVKRDGDWKVRMEGLPRSEKQSRN